MAKWSPQLSDVDEMTERVAEFFQCIQDPENDCELRECEINKYAVVVGAIGIEEGVREKCKENCFNAFELRDPRQRSRHGEISDMETPLKYIFKS